VDLEFIALASILYSDFVLDLDTVACFFALHEIRFDPTYTANPPHPTQSASEYVLTNVELDMHILTPTYVQALRYLNIRFTAAQCIVVGECKN
jgi:hypothetical protein